MSNFKDAQQREWTIAIDAPLILAIREEGFPEFLKGDPAATFAALDDDPALLCGAIWVACRQQATQREVSQASFYQAVIGDAIDDASGALRRAILLFIPRRDREFLQARAATNDKIRELTVEKLMGRMNDPQLADKIRAAIEAQFSTTSPSIQPTSAVDSPALSELAP